MRAEKLEIGKIVAIHALKGEMRVQPWCDTPEFLCRFKRLFLDGEEYRVQSARPHKNVVILKLRGIETPEAAQKLVNKILFAAREDFKLDKGTYLIADLIGLKVVDADDESLVYGELTDVSQTGANDVYHIRFADGKTRYIPAIPQVVRETDPEAGIMKIKPLDGLFDD
ncbi:MAG TPA: 16S rRNA processing protein RimM [Candidatus Merdivicinus intestinavium]|nr:16S rRNA processing protein RimM [Candidatus Merdivicinus intestinavium]